MIVGSIGVGLLILILVWIIAIIVFVIGVKLQNNISWIVLISATVFTAILVLFPLETNSNQKRLEVTENSVNNLFKSKLSYDKLFRF